MLPAMRGNQDSCPECGGHDVQHVVRDGNAVRECGLCGALIDDGAAAAAVQQLRQARERGIDAEIWPLHALFETLPGLRVLQSHGGDTTVRSLPFVQLAAVGDDGQLQLENLAKSLRMSLRHLQLLWVLEVEYLNRLAFMLKPRLDPLHVDAGTVVRAQQDVAALANDLRRFAALSWWRHPGSRA
jgi:hypothetical protein